MDDANGNSKWADAIAKELADLQLYDSFQVLSRGEKAPKGYQFVPMHMVFDVKYDGQHKARYVMNGNVTPVVNAVYAPVASLEIIRILLLIAISLDVKGIDVSCAFIQSKCEELIYTVAVIEWGEDLVQAYFIFKICAVPPRTRCTKKNCIRRIYCFVLCASLCTVFKTKHNQKD